MSRLYEVEMKLEERSWLTATSAGWTSSSAATRARVTYWLAPGRRLILLTVFRKTRGAEVAEVARALQAQKRYEAEHGLAHERFDREVQP